jgi:integrase/recombinase XerD
MLLAVYGLRASEVRRLRLDDFDWKENIFRLKRSKLGPIQQFPLVQTVKQAITRYLEEVRPRRSNHREIFLTIRAPFIPMNTLFGTVSSRWKPLNIAIKNHGPHSLRHACATRLINQGMTLKTIADQLGHRNLETTRIYAKVDLPRLREVANFNLRGVL